MTAGASTRWPAWRAVAAFAVLTSVVTGVVAADAGRSAAYLSGALGYVGATAASLVMPAAITAQVILGLVMVGGLLGDAAGPGTVLLVVLVAAIIATAELLGAAARLKVPFESRASLVEELQRAGLSAATGALAFLAVLFVGRLPGPTGLVAVALAAAACAGLAVLVAGGARRDGQ